MDQTTDIRNQIICMVDTGACEDSIMEDVLENTDYASEDIYTEIQLMKREGLLVDRGAYLVYKPKKTAREYPSG